VCLRHCNREVEQEKKCKLEKRFVQKKFEGEEKHYSKKQGEEKHYLKKQGEQELEK
jgi:hypothetical protein